MSTWQSDSESDHYSVDEDYQQQQVEELRAQGRPIERRLRTHRLGLTDSYCPHWGPPDALRELVQNFLDGVCDTFSVMMDDVQVKHQQKGGMGNKVWTETWIFSGVDGTEYGRIVHNVNLRSVMLKNQGVALPISVLDLGHSGKKARGNQIGGHGEGMKIGILRLLVHNCKVQYITNGEIWNFSLKRESRSKARTLRCKTSDSKAKDAKSCTTVNIQKLDAEYFKAGNYLPLCRERVRYVEGSRCSAGYLLSTTSGDFHPHRVYVKGLYVCEEEFLNASVNLLEANVTRDRDSVRKSGALLDGLAQIWTRAMRSEKGKADKSYTKRFLSIAQSSPSSLEGQCVHYMGRKSAECLKAVVETQKSNSFLYESGNSNDFNLITAMGKIPCAVPKILYRLLIKEKVVLPVQEAQKEEFKSQSSAARADVVDKPVARVVGAYVKRVCRSQPLKVEWQNSTSSIHALLEGTTIFISSSLVDKQPGLHKVGALSLISAVEAELVKDKSEEDTRVIRLETKLFIADNIFRDLLQDSSERPVNPMASPAVASHANNEHEPAGCPESQATQRGWVAKSLQTKKRRLENGLAAEAHHASSDEAEELPTTGVPDAETTAKDDDAMQGQLRAHTAGFSEEPSPRMQQVVPDSQRQEVTTTGAESPASHVLQWETGDTSVDIVHSFVTGTHSKFDVWHGTASAGPRELFRARVNLTKLLPEDVRKRGQLFVSVEKTEGAG